MKRVLCMTVLVALAGCAPTTPPGGLPPATPVFFEPWSAALDDHAISAIATAAQAAQASPTAEVVVTGAADSTGGEQANKYISETRAQMVADQLVTDGVARERIKVRGVGVVSAPTMATGTPAQFSRRVLIQVEAPGSAPVW
jgi:outer membrane protein OmpA-like peptidoglycan-associated protein